MEKKYSVKLSTVASELGLCTAYGAADIEEKIIESADLNRPGIQLLGHLEYFDTSRIQVIGKSEMALLLPLSRRERLDAFEIIMSHRVPAVIFAHDQTVLTEALEMAEKYGVSVFSTEVDTSEFYAQLIGVLRRHLAPRITIHGVLVEVYGEGMLIIGDSGIGKSETALELIKRGHRFIADDAVEILRTARDRLTGRSPEIIRNFMELRGIGVINVLTTYGVGAVKPSCPIDLVVSMQAWDETSHYDRLGLETETAEYLGVAVPRVTVPVRPGRNLAVILEVAAMTNRQRKAGYSAADVLAASIDAHVDSGMEF